MPRLHWRRLPSVFAARLPFGHTARPCAFPRSGQDDEALCALAALDVSIIALETQAMVCLCVLPFTVALAPRAPAVPLASAALTLASLLISVFAQRHVIGLVKRLCPEKARRHDG